MNPALLGAASAAVLVAGLLFGFRWIRPTAPELGATSASQSKRRKKEGAQGSLTQRMTHGLTGGKLGRALVLRVTLLIAAAALGWYATNWLVMLVIGPLAVVWIPKLFHDTRAKDSIARLEALEEWTRSLAGLLSGKGLEQAVERAAISAPLAIRPYTTRLAQRLRARWRAEDALRAFGDELDDATADLAVGALVLATHDRGNGLIAVLEGVAETVSDAVRARRLVEIERDKQQSQVRLVTGVALATIVLMATFGRDYLAPYASPVGQIVLVLVLGVYFGLLLLMRRMASSTPPPRLLTSTAEPKGF